MRNAFAQELTALAKERDDLVLLAGDIGNKLFDSFKEQSPERFYNCGVAEQNMVGVAAGMAKSGIRPVVYTITPFVTTRCYEQIRVDLCYHRLPVVLVGVGSGLSYATLGPTHHSCEDIAILRVLPEMTVLCPGDAMEVRGCLRAALKQEGPVYLRLGKKGEPVVHPRVPEITVGQAIPISEGDDLCLLSTGNILPLAVEVAKELGRSGIQAQLFSCPTVKPIQTVFLNEIFTRYPLIVTLEEHSLLGGFGASIAEWKADHFELGSPLLRFGTKDEFMHVTGSQNYARGYFGLTRDVLCEKILKVCARRVR